MSVRVKTTLKSSVSSSPSLITTVPDGVPAI